MALMELPYFWGGGTFGRKVLFAVPENKGAVSPATYGKYTERTVQMIRRGHSMMEKFLFSHREVLRLFPLFVM